jgi:hypothetical protein
MKTYTKSAILSLTGILLSMNIFANKSVIKEEQYIDDIPFNTEAIATKARFEKAITIEFKLEDETYIDDIPFKTDSLAEVILSTQAMSQNFKMTEENYVDDIPFNTSIIASEFSANICQNNKERN